ncbi:IclR family transcriptional regulator [Microlunatus speluncae]|uniref:IclR family transcriptional regulator n=1 Tax=Microlunatus speluncae TaxID=2594267 RepID=UPI0012666940|nr:helix-turn-helix domain-containing protein [Microlunatus speluncae]
MATDPDTPRTQSLGRGLAVLDLLVRAPGPLTATEVAGRVGMHQTTASRILADLIAVGYVRKISYREFAPDFGLLALGVEASRHFALLDRPRLAMERSAQLCSGLTVSLCMLWRDRLLYFDRAARGVETVSFTGQDYPLHLSSPGLLFCLKLPTAVATELLTGSRAKFGWPQPTGKVPPTEEAVLTTARRHYRHDTLVLDDWAALGHITAAIRLKPYEGHPLALAISGAADVMTAETLRLRLHEARRLIEPTLGC